jgi:hypothetical protein
MMNIPTETVRDLEAKVKELCERFDVSRQYEYVRGNNPSHNLPYHNWYHALCMVEKCVEGANYHNLSWQSMRALVAAALFHDYGHSGGKTSDTENVLWAIRCLNYIGPGRGIDQYEVEQIIRVTEYPYVLEPVCIEQRIIRDADLMQSLRHDTWKEMTVDGLREEMSVKLGRELTVMEMCNGQIEFLNKIVAKTDWGRSVFNNELGYALSNFQTLLNEQRY